MWIPPVNIPSLSGPDYAGQLYGMFSGAGEAFRQNRRDKVGDAQWQQEQERLNTVQALQQSNADRNYALEMQKFQNAMDDASNYYAAQPVYNPETGQWGLVQPNKAGGPASQVTLPEGYEYRPTTQNIDLGTSVQPTARGVPVGDAIQKDVTGTSAAREAGSIQGAAQGILPQARIQTNYVSQRIRDVMNDPDLGLVTGGGGEGGFGGILPVWASISAETRDKARAAQSRVDYVKAQVFPLAYDLIRGAGPIAIYESQAAGAALARLNDQMLSDKEYVEALADFDVKIKLLLKAIEAKASGGGDTAAPGVVTTPDGYTGEVLE